MRTLRALVLVPGLVVVALSASPTSVAVAGRATFSVDIPGPVAPIPPTANASFAEWQQWSAGQAQAVESYDWSGAAASVGCTILSLGFVEGDPNTLGIPAPIGVTMLGTSYLVRCTGSSSTALNSNAPLVPVGNTCAGVRGPGTQCVYGSKQGNGTLDISAVYTYTGSSSIYGHTQLSDDGTSQTCYSAGSGNNWDSENATLYPNDQLGFTLTGVTVDAVWNGNFWKGPPPWNNEGNVCASF